MSQIIDQIFAQVCLDERVKDGVFKLDENDHMAALRDHLVKRGLTLEDAIQISNHMLEGRFPDRQAYRKEDGILVTWPSPKHKAKAMSENPGKYVEEDEARRLGLVKKPAEPKEPEAKPESKPTPKAEPPPAAEPKPEGPLPTSVTQAGQTLAIEPPRGPEKAETPPAPPEPPVQPPTTPERKAAEKAVVVQMMKTDDSALTTKNLPPISENCAKQLTILQEYAMAKGLTEAIEFLNQVKS